MKVFAKTGMYYNVKTNLMGWLNFETNEEIWRENTFPAHVTSITGKKIGRQKFKPDNQQDIPWDDLEIGDIVYLSVKHENYQGRNTINVSDIRK